jgi:hypothetical protein
MKYGILLVALSTLPSLACSPKNVGGPDDAGGAVDTGPLETGGGGPTIDKACADSAYARCTHLQTCFPAAVPLRYVDLATCEADVKAFCVGSLSAPSTGQNPTGVEACVAAIPNWDCGDYLFETNSPPECGNAKGSIAGGAACAFATQCQSGFCGIAPGAACGTCAEAPQPGTPCGQLTTCGTGLVCNAVSATCLGPAAAGAPCAPGQSCVAKSACIGESASTGASGTCQPAVESVGSACSNTTVQCDLFAGLTCNSASTSCAMAAFVGAGQPCGFVSAESQAQYCAGGQRCPSAVDGGQPLCPGISPSGGACDLSAGPGCVSPLRCIVSGSGTAGTCGLADPTACH